jgi:hypothetical protein
MAGANGSAPADPKLTALREAMVGANGGQGVHAYIIPSEDPHMVRHFDTVFMCMSISQVMPGMLCQGQAAPRYG